MYLYILYNVHILYKCAVHYSLLQVLRIQSSSGRFVVDGLTQDSTLWNLQKILEDKTTIHPDYQKSEPYAVHMYMCSHACTCTCTLICLEGREPMQAFPPLGWVFPPWIYHFRSHRNSTKLWEAAPGLCIPLLVNKRFSSRTWLINLCMYTIVQLGPVT